MGCDSQFDVLYDTPAPKKKRERTPEEVEQQLLHDIGEIMKQYAYHQAEYDSRMDQQHSVYQQLRDLEDTYNLAKHKLLQEQQEAVEKAQLYAQLLREDSLAMVQLWKRVYGKK